MFNSLFPDFFKFCFSSHICVFSDEEEPGLILDYDQNGKVIGIEILNASRRVGDD
ncbi:MAG: DUF2283 domain-containing protein [Crinalium sp.]